MPLIRQTKSLCPVCLRVLPARLVERGDEVLLERDCPEHGHFSAVIWRGQPRLDVWSRPKQHDGAGHAETQREKGCPYDCGLCNEHLQHSCTVLFEITQACNLRCPVCFAASGEGAGADLQHELGLHKAGFTAPDYAAGATPQEFIALETLLEQLLWIHSKIPDVVLQISGGEPTLHPELPELVRQAARLFPAVQLNTNGLRLAESPELCQSLKTAGLSWVFLQFDGTNDAIYRALRGRAPFDLKRQAVENCRAVGLSVVLVPTLARGLNDGNIGEILDFALSYAPAVRGVHIQPVAFMGRNLLTDADNKRLTLPEVLRLLAEQSGGSIRPEHASPPGCEHERCSFHCRYLLGPGKELNALREPICCTSAARPTQTEKSAPLHEHSCGCASALDKNGSPSSCEKATLSAMRREGSRLGGSPSSCAKPRPLSESLSFAANVDSQDKKSDNMSHKAVNTIIRSWGGSAPPADEGNDALSRFIRQARQEVFSVTCMAFQDAMTVDLERLQGCCVNVFAPPNRLVPFCAYNLSSLEGKSLHRGRQG